MNKQQIENINYHLRNIYDNVIHDSDISMENEFKDWEIFLFCITLVEYEPKVNYTKLDIRINITPHQLLYGLFSSSSSKYKTILDSIKRSTNGLVDLSSIDKIVTANIDKRKWYFEDELKRKSYIHTFIEISILEMQNIIHSHPVLRLIKNNKINNPTDFQNIINNNKNVTCTLDFIPYLRNCTLNSNIINSYNIYKLYTDNNVKMIERRPPFSQN